MGSPDSVLAESLCVIVPDLDASKSLEACLRSLEAQAVGSRVIFLDTGLSDGSDDIARRAGAGVVVTSRLCIGRQPTSTDRPPAPVPTSRQGNGPSHDGI